VVDGRSHEEDGHNSIRLSSDLSSSDLSSSDLSEEEEDPSSKVQYYCSLGYFYKSKLVTFAVDFVPLAEELVTAAVNFVMSALEFVTLTIELGMLALEFVAFAQEFIRNRLTAKKPVK